MSAVLDTTVLVAGMVQHHPHHERAHPWLVDAQAGKVDAIVAAHSLLETYAVLTRMPLKPRVAPVVAKELIDTNIKRSMRVVAMDVETYQAVLDDCTAKGLRGGVVYDALIARAATDAGATELVTLNTRDFGRILAGTGMRLRAI